VEEENEDEEENDDDDEEEEEEEEEEEDLDVGRHRLRRSGGGRTTARLNFRSSFTLSLVIRADDGSSTLKFDAAQSSVAASRIYEELRGRTRALSHRKYQ
jgi:hypothetical protein